MRAMAMKGYSIFPWALGLQPHHQIVLCDLRYSLEGFYPYAEMQSMYFTAAEFREQIWLISRSITSAWQRWFAGTQGFFNSKKKKENTHIHINIYIYIYAKDIQWIEEYVWWKKQNKYFSIDINFVLFQIVFAQNFFYLTKIFIFGLFKIVANQTWTEVCHQILGGQKE